MGNTLGGKKRRTVKVMKIDGTTFRRKPPVQAREIVRDYPGYDLLESEEVKQLGVRAKPLHPEASLKPGKLYFLVELPRLPDPDSAPRKAWSGALHIRASDRLESLKLSRRSASDLYIPRSSHVAHTEEADGGVRFRMRLPKAEVSRIVEGSKDAAEATKKIMELYMAREVGVAPQTGLTNKGKEKRTRFMPMLEEITTQ